jgi:hypothetical protein
MVDRNSIKPHMPVVCSNNKQFATVDHVDGDYIKLTKDDSPDHHHHWIPLSWVTRVDQHVHIDRPGDQAMREWLSSPPQTATAGAGSSSH